jgi:DNA-binding HxlR family transcriptional regulator
MSRTYGQYCGLARAMELVGERWGMLVVRDLVLGPKRFTDLRETLHRIPASILAARLNEMEEGGVVRRRVLPQLDAAVVYELTEYGQELDGILLQLGLWGARSMGEQGPGDLFTLDAAILSLYTTFLPEHARGVRMRYELRFGPDMVVHAVVDDGELSAGEGALPEADLVVEAHGPIRPLLTKARTARQLADSGAVRIVTGDLAMLEQLGELFHIPPAPVPVEGLAVR